MNYMLKKKLQTLFVFLFSATISPALACHYNPTYANLESYMKTCITNMEIAAIDNTDYLYPSNITSCEHESFEDTKLNSSVDYSIVTVSENQENHTVMVFGVDGTELSYDDWEIQLVSSGEQTTHNIFQLIFCWIRNLLS